MTRPRILIVEDERIVALDLQARLQQLGYQVVSIADTGEEALEIALHQHPDLVMMDIRLKGNLDGIETAARLRQIADIPIIYLTAYADDLTLSRARLTQPYGYLLKPFEEKELRTTIELALYKHQMERRVRESEQWLTTVLKSIGDAVIATDAEHRVKFINPAAESLTGWSGQEAIGKPVDDIFRTINAKTGEPITSPVAEAFRQGQVVYLEDNVELVARDGQRIPIDDSAAPILDERGAVQGVVLVFRDITLRKKTEAQLRQYMLELQQRNRELDAYAHTVAHDLQSPLSPVYGFARLLLNEMDTMSRDDIRQGLQVIHRNVQKMSNIIEELMLLAQVRQQDVAQKPLDMPAILADVQTRLAYIIDEYQAELVLPARWPDALGYAPWVEEVWVNYISNAIKYGGRPPRVELGAEQLPSGMVRFWVKDNGNGLPPEKLNRVFNLFTELSQVRATGHGLGLSIVKRIVEKLGGQVAVESTGIPGQGCVFSFTLPALVPEKQFSDPPAP